MFQAKVKVGSDNYGELFRAIEGEMGKIMSDGVSPTNDLMSQFQEQVEYVGIDLHNFPSSRLNTF